MTEKTLLLIDDNNEQVSVLENIATHLRSNEGINLMHYYFNPNHRSYLNDSKDPDIKKLISGISSTIQGRPNLIVIDLYYGDSPFNGLNVIESLRSERKFKNCPIFLISGKRNKIIEEIFENPKLSKDDKIKKLVNFIELKIDRILDKSFRDEAIQSLKKQNIEEILPAKLREYESTPIHLFSPRYRSLTIEELADKIDSNDPDTPKILEEMFDITLAYYTIIDEKLS